MVREDLSELAMIPKIKGGRIDLMVPGNLRLQANDGAPSAAETGGIRSSERAVIDFD
jgi:hypothetical protein